MGAARPGHARRGRNRGATQGDQARRDRRRGPGHRWSARGALHEPGGARCGARRGDLRGDARTFHPSPDRPPADGDRAIHDARADHGHDPDRPRSAASAWRRSSGPTGPSETAARRRTDSWWPEPKRSPRSRGRCRPGHAERTSAGTPGQRSSSPTSTPRACSSPWIAAASEVVQPDPGLDTGWDALPRRHEGDRHACAWRRHLDPAPADLRHWDVAAPSNPSRSR